MRPLEVHEINVFYRQFAVYRTGEEGLFPMWTDTHVNQGFAWRPESVGFGTLVDGPHEVEIRVSDPEQSMRVVRIIAVPFDIPESDTASLEAIFGAEVRLAVPPGAYTLRAEFFTPTAEKAKVRLTFAARSGAGGFEVVRADDELEVPDTLLLTAEPAV